VADQRQLITFQPGTVIDIEQVIKISLAWTFLNSNSAFITKGSRRLALGVAKPLVARPALARSATQRLVSLNRRLISVHLGDYMKKQIAKTISILSLFVMLSAGAVNVSASSCSSCRHHYNVSATAPTAIPAPVQDPGGQETLPIAQPENSLSFASFLAPWALTFLSLL
jgi:hypothetical protein